MFGRVPSIALYFRVFSSHFLDFRRFWPSPCGDQLRVGDRGAPPSPVAHCSSSWTRSSSAVSESERYFSGTLAGRSIRGCSFVRVKLEGPTRTKNGHFWPNSPQMRDLVGSSAKKVGPAEKKTEKYMNGEQRQNAIQQWLALDSIRPHWKVAEPSLEGRG